MVNSSVLLAVLGLVAIVACTTTPQRLDPDVFYKRDLPYCVAGVGCFEGVSVIPRAQQYDFDIEPKGGADIDLLLATTCHREDSFEKTSSGWWEFKNKKKFKYLYLPAPGLEDDGDCDLRINVYEKEKGRHAWALIRTEHPKYDLPAWLSCNGKINQYLGVSVCQSKAGLVQRVKFLEPVRWAPPHDKCAAPHFVDGSYELEISPGECVYTIDSAGGRVHSMTMVGYDGVLVRGEP